ncbi:hypothetical protein Sjap_009485 [Stephania japonica]|uniref:Uncharacterized protein n=1 Tax=Stephania japonica TaxID=461633 RepID=A0AAP0JRG5_9MAGN
MEIMQHFIHGQDYASIEELYEYLEQLLVDILFFFLPQLPIVILKEAPESPIEVHEERARCNIVTLTLLATSSKLPVDLTTYMLGARDQLSKLSSTDMIFRRVYRLSCLPVVILARISSLSTSSTLSKTLIQALDEALETIYYIDKKLNVGNYEDQRKRQLAKVVWVYRGVHLSKIDSTHSNWSVSEAISSIKNTEILSFTSEDQESDDSTPVDQDGDASTSQVPNAATPDVEMGSSV